MTQSPKKPLSVIIVEDEYLLAEDYVKAIASAFHEAEIKILLDSADLVETFRLYKPDLIITDLVMDSQHEGIQGICDLRLIDSEVPIIAVSGHSEYLDLAQAFGISAALLKPVDANLLITAVDQALSRSTQTVSDQAS